jgi:hypothetical protein
MKVLVAIAVNLDFDPQNKAISAAGNQVQLEILSQAEIFYNEKNILCLLHAPTSSWPSGKLWKPSETYKNILSLSYINLPFIKTISYAFQIFIRSIKGDVDLIIKYNVTFSEAVFLSALKILKRKIRVAVIIQDINAIGSGTKRIKGYLDLFAVHLCKRFDRLIPVSEKIKVNFNFPSLNTYVFRGGITRQTRFLLDQSPKLKLPAECLPYAVFAGALESYNGVDQLINYWIANKPSIHLKIYGTGSLSKMTQNAADCSSANISILGQVDEFTVSEAISGAAINFCLRYSKGINQDYFFPSKFFNLLAAPGILICNNFNNLPDLPQSYICIVNDDLSNLREVIDEAMKINLIAICSKRRLWLKENCDWGIVMKFIDESK